eukprot:SAG31_NODE_461_length_15359_cov_8.989253_8_plen_117_part_00
MCIISSDVGPSDCLPEQDFSGSCSDDDNAIYNNINDCETGVVECTDDQFNALIGSFDPNCFQCLIQQDSGQGGPPDITPCLGAGPSAPPPPCVAPKFGTSSLVIRTQECQFNSTLL